MVRAWVKGFLSSNSIWVSNYSFVEWEYDMAALPWQYILLPYPAVCRLLLGALRTWGKSGTNSCPNHKIILDFSLFIVSYIYSLKPRLSKLHWCPIYLTKLWLLIFATSFSTFLSPLPSQSIFNDFLLNSVSCWNLGPLPMVPHLGLACSSFPSFLFYFPNLTFPYSWHMCFLLRAFVQAFCFTPFLYTVF